MFSSTTRSLGRVTAKYGSAVTTKPKAWRSVLTLTELFPSWGTISPKFEARPSGVIAHSTYVRYSGPKILGACKLSKSALISIRPVLLSTFARPRACGIRFVPMKSRSVLPLWCR